MKSRNLKLFAYTVHRDARALENLVQRLAAIEKAVGQQEIKKIADSHEVIQ